MSDYIPTLVNEFEVRNFFSPPLSYDDINTAEVLLKIESVEKYIQAVYGITDAATGRIPALLLVACKVIENPILANKYNQLSSEKLGDYSYKLFEGKSITGKSSIYDLAASWRTMAIEILEAALFGNKSSIWCFYKVND